MQAYAQYLPDEMKEKEKCCRCLASSAAEQQLFLRHLPRSRHSVSNHCQPLQLTPLTSISHFIMSHHNSRRWQARRCLAFLGVAWRCRCSQISTFTDLSIARRFRSVGSHMQPSMATSRRRWRSHGVGKATPSQYIKSMHARVYPIMTFDNNQATKQ